jgi:F-type H+-transporting ATPase subunit b
MLIDWFTVAAQALNFLILVWLMKRFLYKPIVNAIEEREGKIASQLENAAKQQAEAQTLRNDYQEKNSEIENQRAMLMDRAQVEADRMKQKLFEEARQASETLYAKRTEAMQNEARELEVALTLRTRQEVFSLARKLLADLASTTLEEQICRVFIHRLETMDEKEKTTFAEALKNKGNSTVVRSAFHLPQAQCEELRSTLQSLFSPTLQVLFEISPRLINGIEITTDGYKFAWTIAEYLSSWERCLGELLQASTRTPGLDSGKGNP